MHVNCTVQNNFAEKIELEIERLFKEFQGTSKKNLFYYEKDVSHLVKKVL